MSIVNDKQFELTRKWVVKTFKHLHLSWAFDLNLCNKFVIKQEFKSQYVCNKHYTPWKVYTYSIYALAGLYQKSHSFAALTRSISDTWPTCA